MRNLLVLILLSLLAMFSSQEVLVDDQSLSHEFGRHVGRSRGRFPPPAFHPLNRGPIRGPVRGGSRFNSFGGLGSRGSVRGPVRRFSRGRGGPRKGWKNQWRSGMYKRRTNFRSPKWSGRVTGWGGPQLSWGGIRNSWGAQYGWTSPWW